jgi:hypothetical protein
MMKNQKRYKKVRTVVKGHWCDYYMPFYIEGFREKVERAIPSKGGFMIRYDHWKIADTWTDEMNIIVREEYGEAAI